MYAWVPDGGLQGHQQADREQARDKVFEGMITRGEARKEYG